MTDWKALLQEKKTYLSALRRDFHRRPELGLQEFETARRIEAELDRLGVPHVRVGETGVLGTLRGTGAGSGIVALRADIDALSIQEVNEVDYRSQIPGVMHACGHDFHTACLLGAAAVLAEHREQFGGEVRLIFQPGEEIGEGAKPFVAAGALEGADRVFGLHTAHDLPAGAVGLKPGLNNASVDYFKLTVHGKSSHVSTPQLGVDALYIASQAVVALQAMVTRRTSPVEPVLIGVGTFHAGTTYNALAESAVLEGTVRTVSLESRERVQDQVARTARSVAELYGGSAEITWGDFAPPLINDPQVCAEAAEMVRQLWGEDVRIIDDRKLSLAGDNFAEFPLHCPGAYAYLGTGNPALPNTLNPAHNGNFDVDEGVLPLGAALYAGYALSRLGTNL